MPVTKTIIQTQINHCLTDAYFAELPEYYAGKVRENYTLANGQRLIIVTDRQSAFDQSLGCVPFKGEVLTRLSEFWFEKTRDICPNHFIKLLDPNVMLVEQVDMLPIEIVVRDYLTGTTETSIWQQYARGERQFGGITLPDGMQKNQKLPQTLITPSTKAEQGAHDEPISIEELLKQNLVSEKTLNQVINYSQQLFAFGREHAAKHGLLLVDTKYEFGLNASGDVILADEIHTPDSSRYWLAESYQAQLDAGNQPDMYDKEFLRLWIASQCNPYKDPIPKIPDDVLIQLSQRYINVFEKLTKQTFTPDSQSEHMLERIRLNISEKF